MAKRNTRKRKRCKRKQTGQTSHASLAGLAPLVESKGIFDAIHQQVSIPNKILMQDTLFAFKIVGSILYPIEVLDAIIRREDYMESPRAA